MSFGLAQQRKVSKVADSKISASTDHHASILHSNNDNSYSTAAVGLAPDSFSYVQRAIANSDIDDKNKNKNNHHQSANNNNGSKDLMHSNYNAPDNSRLDSARGINNIQPKLKVSEPGDIYEQEADRVAGKVMNMPSIPFFYPAARPVENTSEGEGPDKKCTACEMKGQQEKIEISRKPLSTTTTNFEASDQVSNEINTFLSGPGSSLDTSTKEFMESRFGYDLSNVRIHTDAVAAKSAESVNALAYTIGNDIVFGEGQYHPNTIQGRRLLAHEMTHVVEQSYFPQSRILMRAPDDSGGASKPPVPKPGHTPFNFISESPALENWKAAVKEMLEREFKMKFNTFEEAQKHFRNHLQSLPSDSAREEFADRMKDRARKAFYRKEGRNPSYAYKPEDIAKLKQGAAPESGMQLEHLEDVKSKKRGGISIKGRPERALDPGNIYVTEGGPSGTAPTGTKHAEKYRTIEAAKKKSLEIRESATKTPVKAEGATAETSAKPPAPTTTSPKPAPEGATISKVSSEASAETRATAKAIAKEVAADLKVGRTAALLGKVAKVMSVVSALQMIFDFSDFTDMAKGALAGEGYVLRPQIKQARQAQDEASNLEKSYDEFGETIETTFAKLFAISKDPFSAGGASSSLADLRFQLEKMKNDLPDKISDINKVLLEARAKRLAALTILKSPELSGMIGGFTFGTAELARLFGVSEDLAMIISALESARTSFQNVQALLESDIEGVTNWEEQLFEICEKEGLCSEWHLNLFFTESRIRSYPAGAEDTQ